MMPTQILRRKELPKFTGYQRTALAELMKQSDFPKPIKLGASPHARKAWLASEIAHWQQMKAAERDDNSR
jgi:prophage regulatory protein